MNQPVLDAPVPGILDGLNCLFAPISGILFIEGRSLQMFSGA
jgi:hypothetical protein